MRIAAFRALLPAEDLVASVSCPPYDVIEEEEARKVATANPVSFLHVTRAEVDLSPGTSPYAEEVYAKAAENFLRFQRDGVFFRDEEPCLFVYRQTAKTHEQTGVVALCHIDDYAENTIRKHENTLKAKMEDRARHIRALCAHAEPVFLFHEPVEGIARRVKEIVANRPLYDFKTEDGIRHRLWRVDDWQPLVRDFENIEECHIADGHHRVAAAVEVGLAMRAGTGNKNDGFNWFLAVLFPANELRILPYNRCVRDLGGLTPQDLLHAVRRSWDVLPTAPARPTRRGLISMYLKGHWYGLVCPPTRSEDPVASLDVSILQEQLLAPILGIHDPTRDPRIGFVGGWESVAELTRRVDQGDFALAFSLYPVDVNDVIMVANAGRVMPPKSTWFEPKLRSGLFAHVFDHSK